MQDTLNIFREMIAREFKVELERVRLDSKFREDFNADSLDLIEFMLEVEREFNIKLENEIIQDLVTVRDAYDFLLRKIQKQSDQYYG